MGNKLWNEELERKCFKKKFILINESLVRNSYLVDKYKNDRTMNGVIARLALPISNVGLKFRKSLLIKKIKRGDY